MAKKLASLRDLLVLELRDLYSAESQLLKALPKMAKAASTPELKEAFEEHLEVTERQVERLDRIFEKLGEKAKGKKCVAMEGLIEEGKETMSEDAEPAVMDAALICAAQKVEHYEMAGYGSARTFARTLGDEEVSELLQQTLEEEAEADKKLSTIAEEMINEEAASGAETEE